MGVIINGIYITRIEIFEHLAVIYSQFIQKDELKDVFSRNITAGTFELVHVEPFFEPVVEEEEFQIRRKVKELHIIVLGDMMRMLFKVYVIYIPIEVKNWFLVGIHILYSLGLVDHLSVVL